MSFASSSLSFDSSKLRKNFVKQWRHYRFASNWEYILVTTACTVTVLNFHAIRVIHGSYNEPTIIHMLVSYFLVGLPLNYILVLLGQYSQLGMVFFKHICPVGHGLGYAAIVISLVWCTHTGMLLADFFMYLLSCMDGELNWMTCPPDAEDKCWDGSSKCKINCISESVAPSTYIFWKEIYMNNIELVPKYLKLNIPSWTRIAPLCFSWLLIYFIVSLGIDIYIKIVRINSCLVCISVIILIFVCFLTEGAASGVALMFRVNLSSFTNTGAWSISVTRVIQLLALPRAFHMTYGSYMTAQMPSDILTIFCVLANFLATFFMSIITWSTIGIIMAEAHLNQNQMKYLWKWSPWVYFTILPQGIGFMGVPQLWTVLYFLVCIAIVVNNLTIQIDAIQRSIADAHSKIGIYQNYILVTLCAFCCSLGFLFSSKESYGFSWYLTVFVVSQVSVFNVFFMCLLTFWVYQVQRISDDIHFMQGSPPTKFWKISWYLMPFIVGYTYVFMAFFDDRVSILSVFLVVTYLSYCILISPIPLCMIYEIFRHLKIHNLVGMLQPEERWGPPDPEERHLRHMFNPRQEIRSRRRDDTCHHNCLLNSKYLKRAIAEEKEQRELRRAMSRQSDELSIAGTSYSTETTQSY